MSKFVWIFVGMALAVFLYAAARSLTKPALAGETAPAGPKCVKERRQHAYGTYEYHTAGPGGASYGNAPIDLTIVECLEWGEANPIK